jgi:hypothetical protein
MEELDKAGNKLDDFLFTSDEEGSNKKNETNKDEEKGAGDDGDDIFKTHM